MNENEQDEPNDDDEIIITYKKFKEMSGHFETLKQIMAKHESEIKRLRAGLIGAKHSIIKHAADTVWFYGANKNMTLVEFLDLALAGVEGEK